MGRRALVVILAAALVVVGLLKIDETPVETLPEFLPPMVEVQTEALGLSASEVEQLITVPLEADLLNGVAWMESIRSESWPGMSSIVMTFEPGTDLLRARQVVQERLTQAAGLPNVSRAPAMVQPLSAESRVMMISLSSEDVSLLEMSVLARWTVRPFLMGVNGVANVSVWGQRQQQLQVHVDQNELLAADLALLDIVKTTGNALWVSPLSFLEASTPGVGGFIDGPNQRVGVQHVLGISTANDLAAVGIEGRDGLTLGDVTTVVEDHQPLIGDAVVNEGPGLLLVVEKFPWSNTVETSRGVEAALAELAPGLTGITVDAELFRPADYLGRSVDNVRTAAIVGLVLAALVMVLLLAGWRSAVVGLASLFVSLIGTGLALFATGIDVNAMVLAGVVLALGLIIDDSVGDTETLRRRAANRGDVSHDSVVQSATGRVRRPMLYATVILAVALIPTFLMEGPAGEFLPTVGLTMLAALVVSTVVATTLTPVLNSLLRVGSPAGPTQARILDPLESGFEWIADRAGRAVVPALIALAVLVVAGVTAASVIDREYVPDFEQTDLLIPLDGVPGTSLEASRRTVTAAAAEIGELPGVLDVGAQVGRAVLADEIVNVNSSQLWVKIDPDANYGDTVDALQQIVTGYPGLTTTGAVSYSNDRVDDVLRRPARDLVLRVYGEDPATLGQLADDVAALVADTSGTDDVRALHPLLEPAIEIEVDLARAAEFGVKPGDVRRTAATLLSGIEVGSFFEQQKVFDVIVWSAPEDRASVSSVEQLLIDTPDGGVVPLVDVANVRVAPVENVIRRDAVSRYIDVVADVSGRDMSGVEEDITTAIGDRGLPYEYHVGILDDSTDAAATQRRVVVAALAVLVATLLLLQAAFGSWRVALVVMLTTPLSIAGGFLILALSGGTYSIGSSIGLLAIFGLTLRHSLAFVDRVDELQLYDGMPFGQEVVATALRDRLGATVISLVAVGVAMASIVLIGSGAGFEVIRPLAVVVLGGLVTSAVVTLLILPAAVDRFGRPAVARESLVTT